MKYFLVIFLLVLSGGWSADDEFMDKLKENEENFNTLSYFQSNFIYIKEQWKVSNIWETNRIHTNTAIIKKIAGDKNFFGNFEQEKADFYFEATGFLYDWDAREASKLLALGMWMDSIDTDLKRIKKYKKREKDKQEIKTNVSLVGYKTLNGGLINRAFQMHRYYFQYGYLGSNYFSEKDFFKVYEEYYDYYSNDLNPALHLKINLGLYGVYTLKTDLVTRMISDLGPRSTPPYLEEMLLTAEATIMTNDLERYKKIREYFKLMTTREFYTVRPKDKYFNYANELIFSVQKSGRVDYSFLSMNSDPQKMEEAIRYYNKALKLDPAFYQCHYNKALIYLKQGRVPKARTMLRTALRSGTTYEILYTMALVEMKMKNYQSAENYLKESLYFKTNAEAFNNLAICYLNNSKDRRKLDVIKTINRAIYLDDKNYRFLLTKAEILKQFNDAEGYTNEMERAVKKLNRIRYEDFEDFRHVFQTHSTNGMERLIESEKNEILNTLGYSDESMLEFLEEPEEEKSPSGTAVENKKDSDENKNRRRSYNPKIREEE